MAALIEEDKLLVEVIYTQTGTTERPGGQQAGIPASEIRITHLPSGISAQCGAARSQHKNRLICLEMIEAALTSKFGNELI